MITAPKISINIPPFNKCGSSNASNVTVSEKTSDKPGVTRIIHTKTIETTPTSSNIVRRHSFRKENPAPPSNISVHTTSFTNVPSYSNLEGSIEQAILRSQVPVNVNESEETSALGHRGIWTNRSEVLNWSGPVPISQYRLNDDPNPEVIHKTNNQPVEYTQEIQVRYLRPPTPPPPGDLIIKQENSVPIPPAPPQIIRQHAPRPVTPEPLIIREAPPDVPLSIARKVIVVQGRQTDAPPRKVIIEKLAPLPPKPQPVIIERWLPYKEQKRRVIYQAAQNVQNYDKVKNLIVQWQSPQANIKKNITYLGVVKADPREYIAKYGSSLRRAAEMPSFVVDLEGTNGYKKHIQEQGLANQLEGDIDALKYIDLDREGLSMYRSYLNGNLHLASTGDLHISHSNAPGRVTTTTTEIYAGPSVAAYLNNGSQSSSHYTNATYSNINQY